MLIATQNYLHEIIKALIFHCAWKVYNIFIYLYCTGDDRK